MRAVIVIATLLGGIAFSSAQAQTVRKVFDFPREATASITIDDAGSAVYAVSSTNQFGTNPGYLKQIVRWDPATGAGMQITSFEEGVESVSVSDDGNWLAFVSRANPLGTNHDESAEIFVMHPDGTGLAQVTSTSQPPFDQVLSRSEVLAAVISGSANRIAFLQGSSSVSATLCVIDRDGTNLRQLSTGVYVGSWTQLGPFSSGQDADWRTFDISDDGGKVVYTTFNAGSLRFAGINANGTGNHTFSSTDSAHAIAISGNGTKIVYTIGGGGAADGALRARTFDGNPATIVSLGVGARPNISDDATQVTFYRQTSGVNPNPSGIWRIASTGGAGTFIAASDLIACATPSGNRIVTRGTELVALDGTGANPQQLTTTTVNETASDFTMTPDGNTVHFASSITPPGIAPRFFSFDLNTGQFWQRAPVTSLIGAHFRFSSDGSLFFLSNLDHTGQNACARTQLFRLTANGTYTQLTACGDPSPADQATRVLFAVRPDGQAVAFLSDDFNKGLFAVGGDGTGRTEITPDLEFWPYVSAAGTGPVSWVAFSTYDTTGGVFRVRADGTGLQQVLTEPFGVFLPTISADGSVVAWVPGYVYDDATQATRRMSPYDVNAPLVTHDGQWVFLDPGRFNVASGALEYMRGGLPDATGNRWLIVDGASATNASKTTLSLADLNGVPSFTVGKASPTVLSWDESPFSLRYDAIRGSISNLSIAGSTVSLGPVSCLEDDSPDTHTQGYGDPLDPAPGQAFFYLYRGSVGFDAAAGSYGQGTGGKERVAGAGGCNP